ncbi:GNAT family N-acetyltransferase [Humidisolicoccus flavus]|uniref:GNAT family N-acetyltransferase n=1 Tax=Humidisolicoccus flavus TaxID=3111414 RepID=UPI00324DD60C
MTPVTTPAVTTTKVTTTTLEMTRRPASPPREIDESVRLDRTSTISPEYARFLYGLVGGPWRWTERLTWSRAQWLEELSAPGTELLILSEPAGPLGFAQLQAQPVQATADQNASTQVELRYFGLAAHAIGRGLGGALLEHTIHAAWSQAERFDLAPITRVWVHTCTLDGPAALGNYQARGFTITNVETSEEEVAEAPLGSWRSTGGAPDHSPDPARDHSSDDPAVNDAQ